jgi:hypothetical protein
MQKLSGKPVIMTNPPPAFEKCYNTSQYLVADEAVVKFKRRVIFKQYIPKK